MYQPNLMPLGKLSLRSNNSWNEFTNSTTAKVSENISGVTPSARSISFAIGRGWEGGEGGVEEGEERASESVESDIG